MKIPISAYNSANGFDATCKLFLAEFSFIFAMLMVKIPKSGILTLTDAQ